jgi:diadenosine tetraphosphatase ApaH/serine/threonine PP2A family protein phosphatase
MRTAVISDLHGNLEATEAVLADVALAGFDRLVCLGDLVGYGADPAACIDLVTGAAEVTVMGNHDAAVSGMMGTGDFNPWADAAIRWTRETLDRNRIRLLSSLPLTATVGEALLVHSSPVRPASWDYAVDRVDAAEALDASCAPIVFIGHTHVAAAFAVRGEGIVDPLPVGMLRLVPGTRYLLNAGSVGQPRDRDPSACWCLWDEEQGTVAWRRVPYAIERTQEKMRAAGLPGRLIVRLAEGR